MSADHADMCILETHKFVDAAPEERKSLAQARKPWVSWANEVSAVGAAQNLSWGPDTCLVGNAVSAIEMAECFKG